MDTLRSPNRRPDAEALSIYELVRRQPRKRILIEPLLWTRLHLDILSCTFSQSNPAPQAMMHLPPIKNAFIVASRRRLFERHFFGLGQLWVAKEGSIRGSLASEPSPLSWRRDLYLYFGSRCSVLPCHYYCLDNIPVAAHVDRSRIMSQRKKRVARVGDRYNPPVWSLGSLKLKKITPTEPLHDPYLVALLIALGQLQWGTLEPQKTRQAAGVTPKLMFSTEDDEFMYIYSTNLSSSFIDMFDNPAVKPSVPHSLVVQISSIPYRPVETFFGRLLALLLSATCLENVDKAEELIVYQYKCI